MYSTIVSTASGPTQTQTATASVTVPGPTQTQTVSGSFSVSSAPSSSAGGSSSASSSSIPPSSSAVASSSASLSSSAAIVSSASSVPASSSSSTTSSSAPTATTSQSLACNNTQQSYGYTDPSSGSQYQVQCNTTRAGGVCQQLQTPDMSSCISACSANTQCEGVGYDSTAGTCYEYCSFGTGSAPAYSPNVQFASIQKQWRDLHLRGHDIIHKSRAVLVQQFGDVFKFCACIVFCQFIRFLLNATTNNYNYNNYESIVIATTNNNDYNNHQLLTGAIVQCGRLV
ncbi:hypothetical protein LTR17_020275 [Elasticomyces elasticus]|nr:hypothetical protein LTR17_020275 [Elasticomyces elasticus]